MVDPAGRPTRALPAPGGEGMVTLPGGRSLYCRRWSPSASGGSLTGRPLMLLHGGGEHLGRYEETAARFTRAGFSVVAIDLPGHGRSPGKRGHIPGLLPFMQDLRTVIASVTDEHHGQRPWLLGHSLGGLLATRYAIDFGDTIQGLVLSSPLWALSVHVPLWKRAVAHVIVPIWPSLTMERPRSIQGSVLSHDPDVAKRYAEDPLVHFRASVQLYTEARRWIDALPQWLARLTVPVLVLQAGDDHVASAEATARLFPRIGSADKTLIVYEGYYHELFNETGKDKVFHDLFRWFHAQGVAINGGVSP